MDCFPITEEQRTSFECDGYLVVPGALDKESIDRLLEAGDGLMDGFEYEGYYAHRRFGLVQETPFSNLATNPAILPLIVQLLGHNLHITNTALIYKHPQRPEEAEDVVWHRDVGVALDLGHDTVPLVGLKVGYCLTDFTSRNSGATLFARGSNHLSGALAIPEGERHPPDFDEPAMKVGDAVLFENRTFHAPGINCQSEIAKLVIYGYHYRWIKADYYLHHYNGRLQPDPELAARLDDIGRQLLGATSDTRGGNDPNGLEWPLREWAEAHGLRGQYPHTVVS